MDDGHLYFRLKSIGNFIFFTFSADIVNRYCIDVSHRCQLQLQTTAPASYRWAILRKLDPRISMIPLYRYIVSLLPFSTLVPVFFDFFRKMFFCRSFSSVRDISSGRHVVSRHVNCVSHLKKIYRCRLMSGNTESRTEGGTAILYEQLNSRGLIRVAGPDASKFLQGLITNDMEHFEQQRTGGSRFSSMFSLLLNHQGRVLYDVFIYRLSGIDDVTPPSAFLIECDARIETDLRKHLSTFNIRRKIDIAPLSTDFQVWALLPSEDSHPLPDENQFQMRANNSNDQLVCAKDPRLASLCLRLVLSASTTPEDIFPRVKFANVRHTLDYTSVRYKHGIAEGTLELPPANCFPLDCNGDYLHGVSFHKGCYVGQELTSRTHHTGVVRKRIMPLVLDSPLADDVVPTGELQVKNEHGKVVGKVRGCKGRFAVGLMRIEECLRPGSKLFCDVDHDVKLEVQVQKPFWWPLEAPKANLSSRKE